MPLIKSAIKRMHQTAKRHARNVSTKRDLRLSIKNFIAKPSSESFKAAQSDIDTAVKKNLLEKNTAARRKSHLARIAKEAGVSVVASSTKKTAPKTTQKSAAKTVKKQEKPLVESQEKTVKAKKSTTKSAKPKS